MILGKNMETRLRDITAMEVRVKEKENAMELAGYVVKWESLSDEIFGFRERFTKGAFQKSIVSERALLLWSHDLGAVLGSTDNRSLVLTEDDIGLRFNNRLPDTQGARDAVSLVRDGFVAGVSFGFTALVDEWDETASDLVIRTVKEARLYEVSITGMPAYPQSFVTVRSSGITDSYGYNLYSKRKESRLKRAATLRCLRIKNLEVGL